MPRRSKGPRLWLEPAERDDAGRIVRFSSWVIRDGSGKHRTGCAPQAIGDAEQKLADYIIDKHRPAPPGDLDPRKILIADVLTLYLDEIAARHARPNETKARLRRVSDHFGVSYLAGLNPTSIRQYVEARGHAPAARRELEDLRAAIGHFHKSLLTIVPIALPAAGDERTRWLTRDEAAKLLWTAWRMRQGYGDANQRRTAQHAARAILIGLYTGTRIGAICGAAIRPTVGVGYIDTGTGVFHRRPPGKKETKKRQPTIRLPDRLLAHLRRWERLGISKKFVVEWNGRPVKRISKSFRAIRAAAKLGDDVVPHTLRHTAATWLMQAACDPWEAAGYLGMSLETLQRVYGHHHPDIHEGARNAIAGRKKERKRAVRAEHI